MAVGDLPVSPASQEKGFVCNRSNLTSLPLVWLLHWRLKAERFYSTSSGPPTRCLSGWIECVYTCVFDSVFVCVLFVCMHCLTPCSCLYA